MKRRKVPPEGDHSTVKLNKYIRPVLNTIGSFLLMMNSTEKASMMRTKRAERMSTVRTGPEPLS